MQLKTVSSIGLAFLLVVGVVGVASAQEVGRHAGYCNSRRRTGRQRMGRDRRYDQSFGS